MIEMMVFSLDTIFLYRKTCFFVAIPRLFYNIVQYCTTDSITHQTHRTELVRFLFTHMTKGTAKCSHNWLIIIIRLSMDRELMMMVIHQWSTLFLIIQCFILS